MTRSTKLFLLLLPLVLAPAGFWLGRATYSGNGEQARIVRLEAENAQLKSSLENLRSQSSRPSEPLDEAHVAPRTSLNQPGRREPAPVEDTDATRALRDRLLAANQSMVDCQVKTTEVQTQLDRAREDLTRQSAVESSLNDQLASLQRVIAVKDSELTATNKQVVHLEGAIRKLTADVSAAGQKASQTLKFSDELQEIHRRREAALNMLISRYKEVTQQYRAFASVLENQRGPEGTGGASSFIAGPELGRIQNTLTMAEEDLRQLNALNAQALRIQKKLSQN